MPNQIKAEFVDIMGTDLSIVNAARVSFDKESDWEDQEATGYLSSQYPDRPQTFLHNDYDGFRTYGILSDRDAKLISFLAREKHEIPFAHTAISLRVSAPVPIARQSYKSKVGFVENEESRRYISSTPEVFYPDKWRKAGATLKQGSIDEEVTCKIAIGQEMMTVDQAYRNSVDLAIETYEGMVVNGTCPEQARFVLPQGCIVNWIWTGSLLAYARFHNLRSKPDAQYEIRHLAGLVSDIIEPLFPVSWPALTK